MSKATFRDFPANRDESAHLYHKQIRSSQPLAEGMFHQLYRSQSVYWPVPEHLEN